MGSRADRPCVPRDPAVCWDFRQLGRDPGARPADRGTTRFRPPTRSAPACMQVVRVTSVLDPAHPDDRDRDPRADLRDLRERDRADGRPGHAAGAAAEPRLARAARVEGHAAQRVDRARRRRRRAPRRRRRRRPATCSSASASRSAACACAGGRRRAARAVSRRVGAHDHARLDVRAGDVELERRRPRRARRTPRRASPTSSRVKPMTLTISGTGSCGELAAGRARGSPRAPCSAARSS